MRSAVSWPRSGSWSRIRCPVVFTLRKGIMFPEKPGMASRELVADDIVYAFNRLRNSPKHINNYFDFVGDVVARDKYINRRSPLKEFRRWDYRLGWGFYTTITPRKWSRRAPPTGRTSTAPARSC